MTFANVYLDTMRKASAAGKRLLDVSRFITIHRRRMIRPIACRPRAVCGTAAT
jgi:hypothetical protein